MVYLKRENTIYALESAINRNNRGPSLTFNNVVIATTHTIRELLEGFGF